MGTAQNKLSDYATQLIACKACQLVGKTGFTRDDIEDIEQELALDLLERLPKFDPSKAAHNTFVARIVERKISKLIRHRTCEARDHRRGRPSLDECIDDGDGATVARHETVAQEELDRRPGGSDRSDQEELELAHDVAAVLARLPARLRKLCGLLKTGNIADAAREMGVPRTTLNEHVKKLRELFEEAGLRDYS